MLEIPTFRNEDEEQDFWANVDSVDYLDWLNAMMVEFPNLEETEEEETGSMNI